MANTDIKESVDSTGTQIELRMCANPEYLYVARVLIRSVAKVVGLNDKDDLVTVAVEEALANVIQHSYGGPCEMPIILKINKIEQGKKNKTALEIIVRDFGKQVDPESIRGRELSDIRPGGLGVHIIRKTMDEVEFTCVADGGMQLRMVKYID